MSNRIDFFQSEETRLAIPAATLSVFVEGALCPDLEVVEVVRGGWPEFGWARLAYNPAAHAGATVTPIEDVQTNFAMGKPISIERIYNGIPPGVSAVNLAVFTGHIDATETRLGPEGAGLEIIARDFSATMQRETVYGQRVGNSNGTSLHLPGLDTMFNPDGRANASPAPVNLDGKSYTMFCAEVSTGECWSYAEVIDYMLCEYVTTGQLHKPDIEQLRKLTEDQTVRDLDVTGLNLLEALQRCCDRIGLKFKFVPRLVPTGPCQAIVFYREGRGRCVELNCQRAGEQFSISRTNIAELDSKKSFWPATHKYIGQGDFKVAEATFELVKAWDPSLEDTNYDKFSPSTNAEFYKVRDVYRKWCLNEAGDYSGAPYDQGDAFDFSKIFGTSNYARRRRRFWPCLTADKQSRSLGYYLQVSYDGENFWQYLYAFNNLLEECGIWLSSDQLDVDTWVAALKGVLRFRITTSVVSDERLSCVVTDGPVNSVAPVIEHVVTLPRQFKYRKVSSQSIFADSDDQTLGESDEADDSAALCEFVRQRASAGSAAIETVDIQTPILELDYQVGDRVCIDPASRDLLSIHSDNRSKVHIERVRMDFRKQCTDLKVVRKRK
ncbi:MAG: hypothetical protein JSU70_18470 [Phycisphaerales bacterium]|nr:MAG: hypothetical protein JSU70_18470 [Phycisphaerales bacterium]